MQSTMPTKSSMKLALARISDVEELTMAIETVASAKGSPMMRAMLIRLLDLMVFLFALPSIFYFAEGGSADVWFASDRLSVNSL